MYYTIYIITNVINNKQYVGFTSKTIGERISAHKYEAKHNSKFLLHKAIRKYGWEGNFLVNVLYMSKDEEHTRKVMEPYFIKEYNTFGKGYNMTFGGDGSPDTPEKRAKISKSNKGKKRTKEQIVKLSESFRNLIWVTNGTENLRLHKDDTIPEGFHQGRVNKPGKRTKATNRPKFENGYKKSIKPRKPMTEEHKEKAKKQLTSGKGTVWMNDGFRNIRVKIPILTDGFFKGRIQNVKDIKD